VRINTELPRTATNKILKRELIKAGPTAGGGVLWVREGRGRQFNEAPDPPNSQALVVDRPVFDAVDER
jgi:fatty-acyl-CoA synthase